jgi:CRP/FNR family cyclic AMP-dependent transcriptional regulator
MSGANNLLVNDRTNTSTQQYPRDSLLNQLRGLSQSTFTKDYPRGSVLFAEGENARGVYVLSEGRAKVSISSAEGKTLVLRVAQPGELLGINATLTGLAYGATVKTLDDCRVDFIPREQFLKLLDRDNRIYVDVALVLSHKVNCLVEQARLLFLCHTAAEKLARLLVNWCDDLGQRTPHGIRIDLRLTHEEMAQMICSSRETVTRLLSDLKQQRILSLPNNAILIRNRQALEALAKC